ncbi:MAG TPA: tetratricopeptide repeat protein [Tepidisphaeraceae bacterium]|jgi:hypothetical protein
MKPFFIIPLALALYASVAAAQDKPAPAGDLKKGAFETTFTERSPLSSLKELTDRLGKPGMEADYDLAKTTFLVAVPEDYDPSKKYGLLVLDNYKDSNSHPTPVLPQLAQMNVIFVSPKAMGAAGAERCGLLLDAVHNLKKQYDIDPTRIYLFACDYDHCGQRVAFGYPDVFTGNMFIVFYGSFKPVRAFNGGTYPPNLPAPNLTRYAQAKLHPAVFADQSGNNQQSKDDLFKFYEKEFKHTKRMTLTVEQYHYPNYTTDWLPDVIKFFDEQQRQKPAPAEADAAPTPATPAPVAAASTPATQPAAAKPRGDDPDKLLGLAKTLVSAGRYEQARTRLSAIIEKYPDSPAAKSARELLDQIKGK